MRGGVHVVHVAGFRRPRVRRSRILRNRQRPEFTGRSGVDSSAFLDGLDNLHVADVHLVHLERVLVEDDEVGKLSDFERSLGALFAILFRRPFGHGLEAFERRHPLVWSDLAAAAENAVYGCPEHHHLVEWGDYEIGVVGGSQSGVDRIAHRADIGALRLSPIGDVNLWRNRMYVAYRRKV